MSIQEDHVRQPPLVWINTKCQCHQAGRFHHHGIHLEVNAGRWGEGRRTCQGKISCFITQNLVVALVCIKAHADRWPGGISDHSTPLWRGLRMHNFGPFPWVSSNNYKVISSKSLPLRPGLLWQPLWVDHLWELNLKPLDAKGQASIVRARSWNPFLWQ